MVTIQFAANEEPVRVSPIAMERLAVFAAGHCEAMSVIAQSEGDAAQLRVVQNVHDWAEFVYHRLTNKNLPTTVVGATNRGGR